MDTLKKLSSGYYQLLRKCSAASILMGTYLALIFITLAVVWFSVNSAVNKHLNQQTDVLGSSLATQAAFNATQSILTNDLLSLNVLLNRLVVSDNILSARVYNRKDELLAEANRNGTQTATDTEVRPSDTHRIFSSPIRFRDDVVGHVLITLDRTSVQSTLSHISNLVVGLGIFLAAVTSLVLLLTVKRLYQPIARATDALEAYTNGTNNAPLPEQGYLEANELIGHVRTLQTLELTAPLPRAVEAIESDAPPVDEEGQFEINFEQIIQDTERESCALFIQLKHLNAWRDELPPLQVANLLTPIYRTIFLASEYYNGQVHQYDKDCVLMLFQAKNCDDNLYMNAASCAQLIQELLKQLMDTHLYEDVPAIAYHMGLHKGDESLAKMYEANHIDAEGITGLIEAADALAMSESHNQLVLTEDVITVPEIQNRIILSLPEIIELEQGEVLAYAVKGLSDKYRARIQEHMDELNIEQAADSEA
ncbi:Bacterial virulence factor hemolysin [Marinomonas aquimarina]|uniref:Bacterial virulence factor hemolysin n=1 Tax=Marinomonas aquimarina TaxID=295068 RepID=A0A1A8T0D4_9GAMM|nr:AhpA/YtjB family protein [Marinomonas aquimarina]SBS24552.1 Bacterial virulence factor hemolysin [Marinomonas aquimarina]